MAYNSAQQISDDMHGIFGGVGAMLVGAAVGSAGNARANAAVRAAHAARCVAAARSAEGAILADIAASLRIELEDVHADLGTLRDDLAETEAENAKLRADCKRLAAMVRSLQGARIAA